MGLVESVHLVLFHWILDDVHGRINHVGRYAQPAPLAPALRGEGSGGEGAWAGSQNAEPSPHS